MFLHHKRTSNDAVLRTRYLKNILVFSCRQQDWAPLQALQVGRETDPAPAVSCSSCYLADSLVSNNTTQARRQKQNNFPQNVHPVCFPLSGLFSVFQFVFLFPVCFPLFRFPLFRFSDERKTNWVNILLILHHLKHLFSATITFEWDFGSFQILGCWRSF